MMIWTKYRARRRRDEGYTLTELMVIVAMLGVILLVSIPQLARWAAKMQIDGTVRQAAMHIAAARLKAVSNGFDHQVTMVPEGTGYTNLRGDETVSKFADHQVALVIDGDEAGGNADDNGNGIGNERSNPLPNGAVDRKLVLLLPYGVKVSGAPPGGGIDPNYTIGYPPPPLVFRKNGQADMDVSTSALYVLYFTNDTTASNADWYAVSVWHSGRIKTHHYNNNSFGWGE